MLGLELGVTMSDFSPLIAWTAPVSSMNVKWKGGRFWCSSILVSLCLYSEYMVPTGKRILLSSSSGPRTAIACAVRGSFSNERGNRIVLSTSSAATHFPSLSWLVFSLAAEVLVSSFPLLKNNLFSISVQLIAPMVGNKEGIGQGVSLW